ncbi:BatA domain-containing protein [Candidatus Entotheonella palauensis]|uniref:BatA domain-containing protein n=1 Tax=Candidatus Entotheonella palauensis TaxID=93172 RepID=UPI000B7F6C47|nr:BatA domain-containing protein [Candidatus Entotheonella palauensis]
MTFLQPLLLFGSLATAIPILIHLIYRRRALVHHFPAVRFLLLADKRTARKFRLHQWLLLALRVLAILLLALALARPYLAGDQAQAMAALPPQANVILIDNSLSMQYRAQETPRLQRAKALASQVLQPLRAQDSALVLPLLPDTPATETSDAAPEETGYVLSQNRETWETDLAAILPNHAAVDLNRAFQQAFDLLRQSPAPRRRLVIVSDFTINGWESFHLSQFDVLPERLDLHLIRLGTAERDANVMIESLTIAEPPFIAGVPLEVTAVLRNRSTTSRRNLRVDLMVDQRKVGQQLVDLRPEEQVAVPFRITAPADGLHQAEIRLEEDALSEDDRFYFAFQTLAPARILIVDGDPGPSLFESEIFYLMQALQPFTALQQAIFHPVPVPWEGLDRERFEDYQVMVLCNVEAVSPQVRQRLHQFVNAGGGLLFFAGNHVHANRYNTMFYRSDTLLLPVPLGEPVQQPEDRPQTIASVDPDHEGLRLFASEPGLLERSLFYRYLAPGPLSTASQANVLLSLANQDPLLWEHQVGRGHVMMFASTADRDWSDLPTRTVYVPLIHGLVSYLANLSAASQRPNAILPVPVALFGQPEDEGASLTIQTADGQKRLLRYVQASEPDNTQVVAHFSAYTVPGIYQLSGPQGKDILTVNATRAESNLTKLDNPALEARLQPLPLVVEEEATFGQANRNLATPSKELASLFLLAVVGLLAIENVYANRL